mmetsp:Transcript_29925/g.85769  ORF Transcript_29925/g.85769 Transcript_29925/m.85769 type:complete len:361 (-) Transcript_29925:236-1318(-)
MASQLWPGCEHSAPPSGIDLQYVLETAGLALHIFRGTGQAALTALATASLAAHEIATATVELEPSLGSRFIFVCGGWGAWGEPPITDVECLSLSGGDWELAPSMPEGRHSAAAAAVAGGLYVCGGISGMEDGQRPVATVVRFDMFSRLWEYAPPMLGERCDAAATAMDGVLYVCGGQSVSEPALSTIECLRSQATEWEAVPEMLEGRAGLAVTVTPGVLYAFGGRNEDGAVLDTAECYMIDSDGWGALEPMSQKRWGAVACSAAHRLFVCGGIAGHGREPLASCEEYDYITGMWNGLSSMAEGRWCAAATSGIGRLYVVGGVGKGYKTLDTAERFDPETGVWSTCSPVTSVRRGAVAAVL